MPHRLGNLSVPVERLFVRGELPRGPAVAIVGTRTPTLEAAAFARALSQRLAGDGVAIVSGGARGIDTMAHEGALEAGGATVVVAPAGYDAPYPPQNRELFARVIACGGAYASLVADDVKAHQSNFFPRNACLVALAHVVVVAEAPIRSGARNAASFARKLGRPLLVVPAAPWNERGRGSIQELKWGASPCDGEADVLEALARQHLHPVAGDAQAPEPRTQMNLPFAGPAPSPAARVLAALEAGATSVEAVSAATGLGAAAVQRHLLTLTLEGVLAPDPAGALRPVAGRKGFSP